MGRARGHPHRTLQPLTINSLDSRLGDVCMHLLVGYRGYMGQSGYICVPVHIEPCMMWRWWWVGEGAWLVLGLKMATLHHTRTDIPVETLPFSSPLT
jgi:hypothetical protein